MLIGSTVYATATSAIEGIAFGEDDIKVRSLIIFGVRLPR